ncbi:hypothetical protein CWI36_0301p0030 [Hamiltosporidium magnivora]|uniref:Helitron helicase-like domain-containing protein n=1 Tax=Hamiltosporidium magnivora TaxID=148818 RepID=A0A4Q9LHK5_9MICR|nr:hypothetical protein CWI36_0301p0030 [Hamiltosporidium magnivora]
MRALRENESEEERNAERLRMRALRENKSEEERKAEYNDYCCNEVAIVFASRDVETPIDRYILGHLRLEDTVIPKTPEISDAMAMVRKCGKLDLFISMTCNPKYDISENLDANEKRENRPDLPDRSLDKNISELPNAHILITLKGYNQPRDAALIDKMNSAEILDKYTHPELFSIITKNMIYESCGFTSYPHYMVMNICSKLLPKIKRIHGLKSDGYPLYRRRKKDLVKIGKNHVDNSCNLTHDYGELRVMLLKNFVIAYIGSHLFRIFEDRNGKTYKNFFKAAIAKELTTDENFGNETLNDALTMKIQKNIRDLFAYICLFSDVTYISKLWKNHKDNLIEEDFGLEYLPTNLLLLCATFDEQEIFNYEETLNEEKRNALEHILITEITKKVFLFRRKGVRGKAYLYKALYYAIKRSERTIISGALTGMSNTRQGLLFFANTCFGDGQFYVAFYSVICSSDVKVYIKDTAEQDKILPGSDKIFTKNEDINQFLTTEYI